ncbi:MAG: carbamoyltransferase HypF [Clostridiales Family XIII bacterium]|jgi:hydrogenase maturation factor HypF (carbamoyltransferase family)|nr:carbamoyltransferase HypF [Clostridiales Family XIII bacterium]
MITEAITFWGIVQGVGFRPTLSRIAANYRMKGQVRNMGAFVQLIVTDEPARIDEFIDAIRAGKPRMAEIIRIDREVIDTVSFNDFRIVSSASSSDEISAVPADIAVCSECLAEFRNPNDPRYLHPFISCTNCGPRYTIMERLPYDRDTTSMGEFQMCAFCEGEYTNPASRRYHAQTVSCHSCKPTLIWQDGVRQQDTMHAERTPGDGSSAEMSGYCVERAICVVRGGGVIALKGVGGYYFVCSPFDEAAVRTLREIKVREYKPFAIMFSSVEDVRAYCVVGAEEEALLTSPKRPIVLLRQDTMHSERGFLVRRQDTMHSERGAAPLGGSLCDPASPGGEGFDGYVGQSFGMEPLGAHSVGGSLCDPASPGGEGFDALVSCARAFASGALSSSRFVGAVLPSMALQYLLLDALGPLIMTSANISDLPIIRDDSEMLAVARGDARIAGVLYNERRIVRRLDDSVARVIDGTPQLIRRSKGWTPVPIYVRGTDRLTTSDQILAVGGHLKSAFALTKGSFVYMSQHIGDIDNVETEQVFEENLASMTEFFGVSPRLVACDMHPRYWTTGFAEAYAKGSDHEDENLFEKLPKRAGIRTACSMSPWDIPFPVSAGEPSPGVVPGADCPTQGDGSSTTQGDGSSVLSVRAPLPAGTDCAASDSGGGIRLLPVQHHHAHIASVMAEHGLAGPVIGIAFDGTGYGTDGTIWGGEALICEGAGFERYSHLRQIEMIGGDSSMRDGWKSAVSRLYDHERQASVMRQSQELRGGATGRDAASHPKHTFQACPDDTPLPRSPESPSSEDNTLSTIAPPQIFEEESIATSQIFEEESIATPQIFEEESIAAPQRFEKQSIATSRTFDIDLSDIINYATVHDTLHEYEDERRTICAAIAQGVNTVTTSSMGRLFDAVASLLGIHHVNRYEGECAIMLENAALGIHHVNRYEGECAIMLENAALGSHHVNRCEGECAIVLENAALGIHHVNRCEGKHATMFRNAAGGALCEADALALQFHLDVANTILAQCRAVREERDISAVCLSGGVFQNKILMEETLRLLRTDGFTPYYNTTVPPNDGCIALGQAYIAMRSV